jgi:hypothetical protein
MQLKPLYLFQFGKILGRRVFWIINCFIREIFGVLIYFKKHYLLGGPMLHWPCIGIEIFKKTYKLSILVALLKKLKNINAEIDIHHYLSCLSLKKLWNFLTLSYVNIIFRCLLTPYDVGFFLPVLAGV